MTRKGERRCGNGAPPGSPECDKLDVLTTLVEAYERQAYPVPEADPVEVLHYAIAEMGRSQKELAEVLGSASRASEVLSRKRALTVDMIHSIAAAWNLPVAALAKPYSVAGKGAKRSKASQGASRSASAKRRAGKVASAKTGVTASRCLKPGQRGASPRPARG